MNAELTRKYIQPIPVSASTALHYRQFKNNTSVTASLGSIPEVADLLKIKSDLENLLPNSERRIRSLQRDLSTVKKHVELDDSGEQEKVEQQPVRKSSGKIISSALIEKLQVKQEVTLEMPESHNDGHMDRQLALEVLRKKRRRDEDHAVKLKKYQEPAVTKQHKKKKMTDIASDQVDFIRVKPKDQIPILTFWSALEPYFRPLTEEDRNFLLPKEEEQHYTIPPLGRHYLDVWNEEDLPINHHHHQPTMSMLNQPITDNDLIRQDITCGPITERLLSSLIIQHEEEMIGEDDDDIVDSEEDLIAKIEEDDIEEFEERLKSELVYIGLLNEEEDWNYKEDDEICAELRATIRELKEQFSINEERKKKLLKVVDNQLQYEQYRHVLDNLDAQVDQCYVKRFRTQKSKKRKVPTATTSSVHHHKSGLSENTLYAMNKRKAWIDALDGIFKDKNMIMPTQSIYE